jgi:predicted metal-dependent enzyme (double-stranded beta helix superfamily)
MSKNSAHTTSDRLSVFIERFTSLIERSADETAILDEGRKLLEELVRVDDWLPARFAASSEESYRQYLLYLDPAKRFSVVSFVWGAGQRSPIHNHTTWGLIGVLRGSESEQHYVRTVDGSLSAVGELHIVSPGSVDAVSSDKDELHSVANALTDRSSISIHVYGGNIGTTVRSVFHRDGSSKTFISGYSPVEAL